MPSCSFLHPSTYYYYYYYYYYYNADSLGAG